MQRGHHIAQASGRKERQRMITLSNGATVIRCEIGYGRAGEQKFIGKVLAHFSTNDPFVAWHIASEDGVTYSCFWGHYCDNEVAGHQAYESKFVGYGPAPLD
tara:strand:+ start:14028 stop:14333 length:306 start_codon:yes stop_codon:yes gene_type:complete